MTNNITLVSLPQGATELSLNTEPVNYHLDWLDNLDLYITELLELQSTVTFSDPNITASTRVNFEIETRPEAFREAKSLDFTNITNNGTINFEELQKFAYFLISNGELPLGKYVLFIEVV